MGQSQMLLLVGALIIFSLINLMVMKQTAYNLEIRCEFEVASDMYRISYNANIFHDSTGTYTGYDVPAWLENTPFGIVSYNITQDEITMVGNVFVNNKEINAIVTPSGYILQ